MKPARWIEITAWTLGIILLSSYAALRVSAERNRLDGVQAFHALGEVDQTGWSRARAQAFRRTTLRELPEGILRIPALRLVVPIYSGTSSSELDRGAGHIRGTAALDSTGNAAIAGHRDGFFRSLSHIKIGQMLYVETSSGTRGYRVMETRVVAPSDVSVLAPTARPSVTLVTCYPFHFVGPAPRRFIIRAELFRERRAADARTADLPQPLE